MCVRVLTRLLVATLVVSLVGFGLSITAAGSSGDFSWSTRADFGNTAARVSLTLTDEEPDQESQ